jgi:hypothetical protein
MLRLKWTNTLNFEHTAFLTEEITEYILRLFGFVVLEKEYYGDPHSVFYATEKSDKSDKSDKSIPFLINRYIRHRDLFLDYIDYHFEMVSDLNSLIEKSADPVYLFGAHIFSQTLIQFGLKTEKIISILDNSPVKQGKRLYGTRFKIESPKVLKGFPRVNVILKAAGYNTEIKKDIWENINSGAIFW